MPFLLSLPPSLVETFHSLTGKDADEWFCAADPAGKRLGSGGGTVWLMRKKEAPRPPKGEAPSNSKPPLTPPKGERTLAPGASPLGGRGAGGLFIIHAGGCSRRIPAYAPSGKVLIPLPPYKGKRGLTLLDLQTGLFERIMRQAPEGLRTLIASGDVLITAPDVPQIPDADVVCLGMTERPELMQNHGVFAIRRDRPDELDFMLQKPSVARMAELEGSHELLMDIGLWLLSDKAVERLKALATDDKGEIEFYDLYGAYGLGLGNDPAIDEPRLADLSVAVVRLDKGRFLHYGTSHELLSSTAEVTGEGSVFVFNSVSEATIGEGAEDIWVENSCLPASWTLCGRNIVTGVIAESQSHKVAESQSHRVAEGPLILQEGQCVDVVPVGESDYALRPYGFNDKFSGRVADAMYMEQSMAEWMARRGVSIADFATADDIQDAELFPVVSDMAIMGRLLHWFLDAEPDAATAALWRSCRRLSAGALSDVANMQRLFSQRKALYEQAMAREMHTAMKDSACSDRAFSLLREGLLNGIVTAKSLPRMDVLPDQMVCAQSPVRADVAGGWTDTPPYSVFNGGSVVNFAFNINGQGPLHVYVRPRKEYNIVCQSVDLGMSETVSTYEELAAYDRVGSPFSIPKAALALSGFLPRFCREDYGSLRRQLEAFGCGLSITMVAAVPAGSGLGTSSILAATVLGALSDFCALHWSEVEICRRTLALEQLLTTGGGWQDQYGGVIGGIKMLTSDRGFEQDVAVRTLPATLFDGEQARCHLMYYTGITRTAKHILVDIVKGMFLHEEERMAILGEMKQHALNMQHAVEKGDLEGYGRLVRRSWELNCRLDSGTDPAKVREVCSRIDDLCLGYKLLGAGGGGYMYMVAKDAEAAQRLRRELTDRPLCANSRFVDMEIADSGLLISRS